MEVRRRTSLDLKRARRGEVTGGALEIVRQLQSSVCVTLWTRSEELSISNPGCSRVLRSK
jgi:hypothetical protein